MKSISALGQHMKTLDDEIADIEKLDELRRQARKLRQDAIDVLSAKPYGFRQNWEVPGDDVEKAQVLRALKIGTAKNKGMQQQSSQNLIRELSSIPVPDDPDGTGDTLRGSDNIPVLRCAYLLQAFSETPGLVLSEAALTCFYRVAQELNEIVHPTWVAGAARGDKDSLATAFVTGECARALLALEGALLQTATAAEMLGKVAAHEEAIAGFGRWAEQEKQFQYYALNVSLATLPRLIIEVPRDNKGRLTATAQSLLDEIAGVLRRTPSALEIAGAVDDTSPDSDRILRVVCDAFAKAARDVAARALDLMHTALSTASPGADPGAQGREIADNLKRGAAIVRDLLLPIEQFAESTIDRQIAAASPHLAVPVDGAELVFAATLLGLLTDWKRPKVRAAYEILYPLLSANGRLLSIRPFDLDSKGYRLNVATLEITRRLADLVANIEVEPEPDFVTRLMLPFEYTRAPGDPAVTGWTNDPPPREPKSLWWLTSVAAGALDSTVRMLDKAINRRVLGHFQVRAPESLKLKLDELFYPDYGLATRYDEDGIGIVLQRLRAHAGTGSPEPKPLFSLILYGPPGTGKTTMVEALAGTAGVPLVEVTPSDILVGGVEGMERRARQVFLALSKLTHTVILFDEFDSILLDRAIQDTGTIPTSVTEFLTPGMLPKLKTLHDASENGRVSYVLATNYLDRIDSAASRNGRFDKKIGIYPPDVVSRLGRLRDQFGTFLRKPEGKRLDKTAELLRAEKNLADLRENNGAAREIDAFEREIGSLRRSIEELEAKIEENKRVATDLRIPPRILQAVVSTNGGPMSRLGKPGWGTAPEDEEDAKGKLFGYILSGLPGGGKPAPVEREASYEDEKVKYDKKNPKPSKVGLDYWKQWKTIVDLDDAFIGIFAGITTWPDAVKCIDNLKPKLKRAPKPKAKRSRRA
jgi:ATPase family associated with various cellular activities (AAA)